MSSEINVVTVPKSKAPIWLWSVTAFLFLVQTFLYVQELDMRHKAEDKLQKAFLELNDERGKNLDLLKERTEFEDRLLAVRDELEKLTAEVKVLTEAKAQLEKDNLEKEKMTSEMTKKVHDLEMEKLQLAQENKALKEPPATPPVQALPAEATLVALPQN